MPRSVVLIASIILGMITLLATPPAALAQEAVPVETLRWDADLTVGIDGSITVRETHEIAFGPGEFSSGFRTILARDLTGIEGIRVSEGDRTYIRDESGQPGTFTWEIEGPYYVITWYFEPTSDATRTFVIEYVVLGAVEIEASRANRVLWDVIPSVHDDRVDASNVIVRLPAGSRVDRRLAPASYGVQAASAIQDDPGYVAFRAVDISAGDGFRVEVYFTLDNGTGAFDDEAGSSRASRSLAAFGISILLLLGIVIFIYTRRGRRAIKT